jgi:hypothetical protein
MIVVMADTVAKCSKGLDVMSYQKWAGYHAPRVREEEKRGYA